MLMTSGFVGSIACPAHQILHRNDSTKLHISEGGSLEWECSTITGAVCPSWEMTSLSEEEFTLPPAFWVHSFLFSFPGRLATTDVLGLFFLVEEDFNSDFDVVDFLAGEVEETLGFLFDGLVSLFGEVFLFDGFFCLAPWRDGLR